jgi:hypothetical protein
MLPGITPQVFDANQSIQIQTSLDDIGYAVIKIHTINTKEIKHLFRSDMEQIYGQSFEPDINIWNMPYPPSKMPGLIGEYGLSQGNAAWKVRTDPTIQDIFKQLLQTDDIVCSMDAIGYSDDSIRSSKCSKWLHVDQNPHVYGGKFNSIQGIYYAEDTVNKNDIRATTVVVPRSHHDIKEHAYKSSSHFHIVDQDKYWPDAVRLNISAGCMLIYTSKLVHQGWHGSHRLCFMVSYGKKCDRTEHARRTKVMMYLGGHRTNHYSQFAVYHGQKWEHGSDWNMLRPTLRSNMNPDDRDVAESFIDDYETNATDYEDRFDSFIPNDRLMLL